MCKRMGGRYRTINNVNHGWNVQSEQENVF